MFNISPIFKIGCVFFVCLSMAYVNYLLFNADDFVAAVKQTNTLYASALVYLFVILLFADYFLRLKRFFVLATWLVLNASFCVNFLIWLGGETPPVYLQYSQSSSLLIFAILLIASKDKFPNWLRLFSLACLLDLIPCLIYFFSEMWTYYEITVYVLCFIPVIMSFVFLKDSQVENAELLDN